jgi:hypothetical protein
MGKIRILNDQGDATLVIDAPPAEGETRVTEAEARKRVRDHVARGGLAYSAKPGESEVIRDFDPRVEETVLAPRMQGGA